MWRLCHMLKVESGHQGQSCQEPSALSFVPGNKDMWWELWPEEGLGPFLGTCLLGFLPLRQFHP